MFETEVRFFWIAAQRLRLTTATIQEVQEAFDDVVAVALHTGSEALRARCMELIEEGAEPCASSA
jgi:hypothetical protein